MDISPEIFKFMTLFQKLRSFADDDPDCVVDLAEADPTFAKLCSGLWGAAQSFSHDMEYTSLAPRFTAPVDPKFIEAWRDYETRWEGAVGQGNWIDTFGERLLPKPGTAPPTKWDMAWKKARIAGQEFRFGIDAVIAFASQQFEVLHPDFWDRYWSKTPEADAERLEEIGSVAFGLDHWCRYRGLFDFSGVIRRLHLVPFVLIPRLVAKRHGETEPLSLYTQLRQAQEAFVFGIPFAALAMMRSLLELVLREHYHANGKELDDLINGAKLPKGISRDQLHQLRKLANRVLHANHDELIPSGRELEERLVRYLTHLQRLIEKVPS